MNRGLRACSQQLGKDSACCTVSEAQIELAQVSNDKVAPFVDVVGRGLGAGQPSCTDHEAQHRQQASQPCHQIRPHADSGDGQCCCKCDVDPGEVLLHGHGPAHHRGCCNTAA